MEESGNKIFINTFPDAGYVPSQDILAFRNLGTISSIFNGIDALYKEATQEEVENFLSKDFIGLSNEDNASKVSKPNRKRIALAMDSVARLEDHEKDQILGYIHSYCENISYDQEQKKFQFRVTKN